MTAATFERLAPSAADELLRARFEALVEWGVPLDDAREIAAAVAADIVKVFGLLRRGCPPKLVLELLI